MKRRDLLRYTALVTGAALSAPLILSLDSCKVDSISKIDQGKLHYFDEDQMRLVRSIVDTILPKSDSPSASEVGVHRTIDEMVGLVYQEEDQKSYRSNFLDLSKYLNEASNNKGFQNLTENKRLTILRELSKLNDDQFSTAKDGYIALKQQTIAYYLNTEEVATKFMNYLPVPGQYEGCISLESVGGKAWAI